MKNKKIVTEFKSENQEFLKQYHYNVNLDENSCLAIKIDFLNLIGQGTNEKEAYINAFDKLKKQIYQNYNNLIVHLETMDVIILEDNADLKIKRIMGLMPHKKMNWEIKLRIIYKVKYIKNV